MSNIGSILIAFGYLAVVVFIMLFCADQSSGFDEYSKYWGLFGTLVGVATGAIPSYFFKQQATSAQNVATAAVARAEAYAAALDPGTVREIRAENRHLF